MLNFGFLRISLFICPFLFIRDSLSSLPPARLVDSDVSQSHNEDASAQGPSEAVYEFQISAVFDYETRLMYYKDTHLRLCFAEEFHQADSDAEFILPDYVPQDQDLHILQNVSSVAQLFCGRYPIYLLTLSEVTRSRTKRSSYGFYTRRTRRGGATQYQVQNGHGFYDGQSQPQPQVGSQHQTQFYTGEYGIQQQGASGDDQQSAYPYGKTSSYPTSSQINDHSYGSYQGQNPGTVEGYQYGSSRVVNGIQDAGQFIQSARAKWVPSQSGVYRQQAANLPQLPDIQSQPPQNDYVHRSQNQNQFRVSSSYPLQNDGWTSLSESNSHDAEEFKEPISSNTFERSGSQHSSYGPQSLPPQSISRDTQITIHRKGDGAVISFPRINNSYGSRSTTTITGRGQVDNLHIGRANGGTHDNGIRTQGQMYGQSVTQHQQQQIGVPSFITSQSQYQYQQHHIGGPSFSGYHHGSSFGVQNDYPAESLGTTSQNITTLRETITDGYIPTRDGYVRPYVVPQQVSVSQQQPTRQIPPVYPTVALHPQFTQPPQYPFFYSTTTAPPPVSSSQAPPTSVPYYYPSSSSQPSFYLPPTQYPPAFSYPPSYHSRTGAQLPTTTPAPSHTYPSPQSLPVRYGDPYSISGGTGTGTTGVTSGALPPQDYSPQQAYPTYGSYDPQLQGQGPSAPTPSNGNGKKRCFYVTLTCTVVPTTNGRSKICRKNGNGSQAQYPTGTGTGYGEGANGAAGRPMTCYCC